MTKFIATTGQAAARVGSARYLRPAMLADWVGRYVTSIIAERRIRRGIQELKACDDRMLVDIGVYRSDIEHVARYGRVPRRGPDGRRW